MDAGSKDEHCCLKQELKDTMKPTYDPIASPATIGAITARLGMIIVVSIIKRS